MLACAVHTPPTLRLPGKEPFQGGPQEIDAPTYCDPPTLLLRQLADTQSDAGVVCMRRGACDPTAMSVPAGPSRRHKSTLPVALPLWLHRFFPTAADHDLPSRRGQQSVVNYNKHPLASAPAEPNDPITAIVTGERDQFNIGISRTESQHPKLLPTPVYLCLWLATREPLFAVER